MKRTAHILQVCAVDFTAFHLLRPLMHACRGAGWSVEFSCGDGPAAAALREEGFLHRPVPMSRRPSPLRQLRAIFVLAASLRRDPPDLVHTHTPVGGVVGRAAAILAGQRLVVHTFHGLPFVGAPRSPLERAFLMAERLIARRTTYFFSQASGDVERAVRLGIARAKDTLVIGNGVDVDRFAPDPVARATTRAALGIRGAAVVVVTVARLVREKGLLELADAAYSLRRMADLHFVVVGAALPSDRSDIGPALAEHPVADALGSRWRLLGYREDVADVLKAGDIFVLPSYREGLPRSVIEAMASGLAVVATDIPACRELLGGCDCGTLVPARDAQRLADAIRELAEHPEARARMGQRARQAAAARYDERDVLRRQMRVFRDLLSS